MKEIREAFAFEGELISQRSYGSGHINDTFLLVYKIGTMGILKVILQKLNKGIFKNPVRIIENIDRVTTYLRESIKREQGDVYRETLTLIPTKDGKPYYLDSKGEYWRAYIFITDATSYDQVENPKDFYNSALAFGNFQRQLSNFPAKTLYETIPDFHNTKVRFHTFLQAVNEDPMGRAKNVEREIEFVKSRREDAFYLQNLVEKGEIPLRVTHNDTKLNNIMIDNKTHKGICVIDLDTVMPGLAINDFGDSIRFGANHGAEDERNLDEVYLEETLYDIYTKGFLEGVNGALTKKEIELLPLGAKAMTLECGIRFLTDYLNGDTYFKIHRPEHNLDRAKCQFKLLFDMEGKMDMMCSIVEKYS